MVDFREDGKQNERKWGGKEIYWGVWLGGFVEIKLAGFRRFLSGPTKMFSLQIGEKFKEKTWMTVKDQICPITVPVH